MKKILAAVAVLACALPTAASADMASSSVFDDAGAFVIARSVKLGDTNISIAPKTAGTAQKTCAPGDSSCSGAVKCSSDSDCKADEYCTSAKTCKPLCERGRTLDKEKCAGETPVCATDNHKSYCACNDESCGKAYKCGKTGSRYACNPCAAGESCGCPAGTSSNGAGACVTCNKDADCAGNQVCENKGTVAAQCKILTCDADKYAENHECKSCSGAISNCATCNSASVCTGCQPGYNLVNGKCELRDCGAGMYLNMEDGQCYACSNGCKSCTGENACTECENAYNLSSGYCVAKTCEAGMYLNSSTGECLSCPSTCTACATVMSSSETTQCTTCAEGYRLDASTGTCVALNCADSEYVKGNECLPCSGSLSNCLTCSGENTCTGCANGYTVQNGKCVSVSCPAGSYLNMNKNPASCDSCASPCSTCSGTASTCTSCTSEYKLSGNSCVAKTCSEMGKLDACPPGYIEYASMMVGSNICYGCKKPGDYCASDSDCSSTQKCSNYRCATKSCSELGLKTSCAAGEKANSAGVSGSDGACYSCSKIAGWCSSDSDCSKAYNKCVNNACVLKKCAEIGSSLKTSCAASEDATYVHVDGSDGKCYECSKKEGWCSSNSDCGGANYKCVSNSCVLKSCGELGYATSCSAGYTASAVPVPASDGTCYTCSKIAGWCSSASDCSGAYDKCVNNSCVQKTCAEIGSQLKTSCAAGYTKNDAHVSGSDGKCYECSKIAGWCSSASDCSGAYDKCVNNSCVKKTCAEIGSKLKSSCAAGEDATYAHVNGSDGKCYECSSCPSGYSTNVTSCGTGYTLSTNGTSGGKTCGKCDAASCPSGYSTSVTSCSGANKLETNGYSGGKACGKCVLKTCAEQGYSTSCASGYTPSTYGSNGSTWTHKWSGSDGTCYDCVKRTTSSSSSSSSSSSCVAEVGYTCVNGVKKKCNSGCQSCAHDLRCMSCLSGLTMYSGSVCR